MKISLSVKELGKSNVARVVKNPTASAEDLKETRVLSLGWEDPLEKSRATHSYILARSIWCTEEPGGSQRSPWGHKESDTMEET